MRHPSSVCDGTTAHKGRRILVTLSVLYFCLASWLALTGRVFIDQVWIIEYGRLLLEGDSQPSMLMLASGSSPSSGAWLGALLAEYSFGLAGLPGFRILNIVSLLVVAWSTWLISCRLGAPPLLAALLASAIMLDPSMNQSVLLGRADALALALFALGLAMAQMGVDSVRVRPIGWGYVAVGYGLTALSPAAWVSALLIGPVALIFWLSEWRRARRTEPAGGNHRYLSYLAFFVVPGLVFLAAVVAPSLAWLRTQEATEVQWILFRDIPPSLLLSFYGQQVSLSAILGIAGLCALWFLQPRWLKLYLSAGAIVVLASGFYAFRVPYLLSYLIAAILVALPAISPQQQLGWSRLLAFATTLGLGLLLLRLLFSIADSSERLDLDDWLAALPAKTRIADYSWDIYAPARRTGHAPLRSLPGLPNTDVEAWLTSEAPDLVVHAWDSEGSWERVDDLRAVLPRAGYCRLGVIDRHGRMLTQAPSTRRAPTPTLWRLGLFKPQGPYELWQPCATFDQRALNWPGQHPGEAT